MDEIETQAKAVLLYEMGVNFGIITVIKMAQRMVKVDDDGIVGSKTISALNSFDESLFQALLRLLAIDRYRRICNNDKKQNTFLLGWLNRVFE